MDANELPYERSTWGEHFPAGRWITVFVVYEDADVAYARCLRCGGKILLRLVTQVRPDWKHELARHNAYCYRELSLY